MTKKIGDRPIKGVKSPEQTKVIKDTATVSGIEGIKPAQGVRAVGRSAAGKAARLTRTMTLAEREYLFRLINEEAERMVKSGELDTERRAVVESAVKIAVDSALLEDDQADQKKK